MLLFFQFLFISGNLQTDWNDGRAFSEIIKGLGGPAPAPDSLNVHHSFWENNIKKAGLSLLILAFPFAMNKISILLIPVDAGKRLGVQQPVLSPKDMTNPDVEHLGIMSYVANLQWVTPRPPLSDAIRVNLESTSGRVGEPVKWLLFTYHNLFQI